MDEYALKSLRKIRGWLDNFDAELIDEVEAMELIRAEAENYLTPLERKEYDKEHLNLLLQQEL